MAAPLLNLVVLRSSNLILAQCFYELIGLSFLRHQHGKGPEHLACENEGVVFEIYPQQSGGDTTKSTRVGFQVDQIDTLLQTLREQAITILMPPRDSPWGRRAVVLDPDGHKVELVER
ncbi:MAG: VOC family protein [Phycisphaerales bacterium JB063]